MKSGGTAFINFPNATWTIQVSYLQFARICLAHYHILFDNDVAVCFISSIEGIIKKCLQRMEKYELILTSEELLLLAGLVELLDVFNIFTKYIQGNSYPTMNTVALFYTEIEDRLSYIAKYSAEKPISTAASLLLNKLPERIELLNEFIAASLLDPRLQHLEIIERWLSEKGNLLFIFHSLHFQFYRIT